MERKYGSIIGTQLSQNMYDLVCFIQEVKVKKKRSLLLGLHQNQ